MMVGWFAATSKEIANRYGTCVGFWDTSIGQVVISLRTFFSICSCRGLQLSIYPLSLMWRPVLYEQSAYHSLLLSRDPIDSTGLLKV